MRWLRTPLAPLAIAFVAGIAGTELIPSAFLWALWLAAIGAALVLLVLHRPACTAIALLLGVVAIGALRGVPAPLDADDVARLALPREATVAGMIADEPARLGPERERFVLDVVGIDGAARSGRVQMSVYGGAARLHEGQRISVRARLRRATGYANPDGFDYAAFLARDGIHVIGSANARAVTVLDAATPWNVEVRRRALATIDAALPPVSAALLGGLLLGARGELPADVLDAFRRAGVYHVLAVSGFNVALVASFVFAVVLIARASQRAAAVAAIVVVLGFAAVVGPQPSVLRAAVMGVLVLVAILLDRDAAVVNSLALAAIAILAVRPGDLRDPGFQLSFAATLGLVLAPQARGLVLGSIGVSLGAQLAVLPITLVHFNQVSTIGILANLGIVPLAGLATVLGLAAVAVSTASDALARVLFDATWPVLIALRTLVWLAASMPAALVHLPAPHWSAIIAYTAGLGAALVAWRERQTHPRLGRVAGAAAFWLLAGAVIVAAWPLVRPGDGRLHVTALDVGRGAAVVVEAPDRQTLVIAAGTRPETAERVIAPYLWNRGVQQLVAVVTTVDSRDTGERLRRLFTVESRRPIDHLGAVTVAGARDAAEDATAIRLGYRLASVLVVLDPAFVATRPDDDVTVLITPLDDRNVHAAAPARTSPVAPAFTILSVGGQERERADSVGPFGLAGAPLYRTDRDGAVLLETDGRVLDLTRWATRVVERYCVDPESPCPPLSPPARIRARRAP